jgi:hypothetical protein
MTKKPLNSPRLSHLYICEECSIQTNNKKDYSKHLLTRKHINNDAKIKNDAKNIPTASNVFICKCGKKYKYRQGLHIHKKTCQYTDIVYEPVDNQFKDDNSNDLKELVIKLLRENADFKNSMIKENEKLQNENVKLHQQILDVYKNIQPSITNINNNNNNKTFNLQFFLNEQCKDAMNISEFINSFTLSINDLERVGSLGYVEGISSIILKELRNLDIHKRPVHCSDTKRETLYIKDENKWEKEDQENKKIKNVIKSVEHKNIKMINEWTKEHTNYKGSHEKDNDKYLQIVLESAGGIGDYAEKGNKIIKKIAKEVAIDK